MRRIIFPSNPLTLLTIRPLFKLSNHKRIETIWDHLEYIFNLSSGMWPYVCGFQISLVMINLVKHTLALHMICMIICIFQLEPLDELPVQ